MHALGRLRHDAIKHLKPGNIRWCWLCVVYRMCMPENTATPQIYSYRMYWLSVFGGGKKLGFEAVVKLIYILTKYIFGLIVMPGQSQNGNGSHLYMWQESWILWTWDVNKLYHLCKEWLVFHDFIGLQGFPSRTSLALTGQFKPGECLLWIIDNKDVSPMVSL